MVCTGALIVDSRPPFRGQILSALETAGDFTPLYEAESVPKAKAMLEGFMQRASIRKGGAGILPPSLVVLEDRGDGLWPGLVETFTGKSDGPKFFILSDRCEPEAVRRAFRAGAGGYGSTMIPPAILILGLRLLLRGESFVESAVLRGILEEGDRLSDQGELAKAHVTVLTERERQAFRILASGGTTKDVASALGVSRRSAENYQAAIYRKLGINSPTAMALLGIRSGILDPKELEN